MASRNFLILSGAKRSRRTHGLFAAVLALLAVAGLARAVEPGEMLSNPVLEARARAIGKELRCLVCQNESIDDSNADLAHDLRVLLRERLVAGDTDAQATQYIVDRYGQFVLLKPPVEPATYVLWFGPLALLLVAGAGTVFYLRRHRPEAAEISAPLSADERQRIDRLLGEGDA
jgi:cytochrome c-type biogenesis protein CcmH